MKNAFAWWCLISILYLGFEISSASDVDPEQKPDVESSKGFGPSEVALKPREEWERNEPARKKLEELMEMPPLQILTKYYIANPLDDTFYQEHQRELKQLTKNYKMSPSEIENVIGSLIAYKRITGFELYVTALAAMNFPILIPLFEKLGYVTKLSHDYLLDDNLDLPYPENWNRMAHMQSYFNHDEFPDDLFNLHSLTIAQLFRAEIRITYDNGPTLEFVGSPRPTIFRKIICDSYLEVLKGKLGDDKFNKFAEYIKTLSSKKDVLVDDIALMINSSSGELIGVKSGWPSHAVFLGFRKDAETKEILLYIGNTGVYRIYSGITVQSLGIERITPDKLSGIMTKPEMAHSKNEKLLFNLKDQTSGNCAYMEVAMAILTFCHFELGMDVDEFNQLKSSAKTLLLKQYLDNYLDDPRFAEEAKQIIYRIFAWKKLESSIFKREERLVPLLKEIGARSIATVFQTFADAVSRENTFIDNAIVFQHTKKFENTEPAFQVFYSAYKGEGHALLKLFEKFPNLVLLATSTGNTPLHAWLRVKRGALWTNKLLYMFLDKLRESDRIPSDLDFDKLGSRIMDNVEEGCTKFVLLWTLNLYGFHMYKSNKSISFMISIIVEKCSQEGALDYRVKAKLLEHLLIPVLHFHKPDALEGQDMKGIYYNASLFQDRPSEDLLDQIEQLYKKIK